MTQEIQLKNGSVLVSVNGYSGESDFYAMYDIIKELLYTFIPVCFVQKFSDKFSNQLYNFASNQQYDNRNNQFYKKI